MNVSDLDSVSLILILGHNLIAIAGTFYLRKKWPGRYHIGILLCLFSPSWGQIYLKSKYNWIPWFIFLRFGNGLEKANTSGSLMPWVIVGTISAFVIFIRIMLTKQSTLSNAEEPVIPVAPETFTTCAQCKKTFYESDYPNGFCPDCGGSLKS